MYYLQCLQMNCTVHFTCNFNRLFENGGLLKIAGSHVHCKCGNILEMVQDRDEKLLLRSLTGRRY